MKLLCMNKDQVNNVFLLTDESSGDSGHKSRALCVALNLIKVKNYP